jgi:hypothetical protein
VGARTSAARTAVLAAREELDGELRNLEASGRAAADIPARVRREPVKTVGLAAGAAFLLGGGPGRVARRVKRAIRGPEADLPKSMLPDEVEKTLRKMGTDGDKIRGTLEREFAKYLDEHAEERKSRDLGAVAALLLSAIARPAATRAGKQLAERLMDADADTFAEQLARVRGRTRGGPDGSGQRNRVEPQAELGKVDRAAGR